VGSEKKFWNRFFPSSLALLFAAFEHKIFTFPSNFFFRKKCDFGLFFSALFGLYSAQFQCIWALFRLIWEPLVYLGSLSAEVVRFRRKKLKNFPKNRKFFIFFKGGTPLKKSKKSKNFRKSKISKVVFGCLGWVRNPKSGSKWGHFWDWTHWNNGWKAKILLIFM